MYYTYCVQNLKVVKCIPTFSLHDDDFSISLTHKPCLVHTVSPQLNTQYCLQVWCWFAVHDGSFSLSWVMRCLWMRLMVRAVVLSGLVPPSHLTTASTGAWQRCHTCLAPQWSRRYPADLQQNHSLTLGSSKLEWWWCRCMCRFEPQQRNVINCVRNVKKARSSGSMGSGKIWDRSVFWIKAINIGEKRLQGGSNLEVFSQWQRIMQSS